MSFELTIYSELAQRETTAENVVYFEVGDDIYVEYENGEGETIAGEIVAGSTE